MQKQASSPTQVRPGGGSLAKLSSWCRRGAPPGLPEVPANREGRDEGAGKSMWFLKVSVWKEAFGKLRVCLETHLSEKGLAAGKAGLGWVRAACLITLKGFVPHVLSLYCEEEAITPTTVAVGFKWNNAGQVHSPGFGTWYISKAYFYWEVTSPIFQKPGRTYFSQAGINLSV